MVPPIILFTDLYFFKVSESQSLIGQNRPVRKQRKPAKLREASLSSISSDDGDSNLPATSISKNSKEDKQGITHFIFHQWNEKPLICHDFSSAELFELIDIFFTTFYFTAIMRIYKTYFSIKQTLKNTNIKLKKTKYLIPPVKRKKFL